jgi:alpha-tubulin suppressor-like RCC1 family protein
MSHLIRGYVVESRKYIASTGSLALPEVKPAKNSSGSIYHWSNNTWICGNGGEGRTGLKSIQINDTWQQVPIFDKQQTNIQSMALGGSISLFLSDKGEVYACGFARRGQIADSSKNRWACSTPTQIRTIKQKVVQVAAGLDMGFALTNVGVLYAWGSGSHGKLGLGDCEHRYRPEIILPLSSGGKTGVVHVAAGAHHAHALTAGGKLYSWGINRYGQLGTGYGVEFSPRPLLCDEFKLWGGHVKSVFTSAHFSMAIVQLQEPVRLQNENIVNERFKLFTRMKNHFRVPPSHNRISAWGAVKNISEKCLEIFNDLENEHQEKRNTLQIVDYPLIVKAYAFQYELLYTILCQDAVCDKEYSQLQKATMMVRAISVLKEVVELESGGGCRDNEESTFLKCLNYNYKNSVFVWGQGDQRLGIGKIESIWFRDSSRSPRFRHQYLPRLHKPLSQLAVPQEVSSKESASVNLQFDDVTCIALGEEHGLAVTRLKKVYVWGSNKYGQLGIRLSLNSRVSNDCFFPTEIVYLSGCQQIAAGKRHSLALRDTGEAYSWGLNNNGQLGHGDRNIRPVPYLCLNFTGRHVQYISAGDNHSALITSKAATIFGKPAYVSWACGIQENGSRFRSSPIDKWLPVNRSGSILPQCFAGITPSIIDGIFDSKSGMGLNKNSRKDVTMATKSTSSSPFTARDIWIQSGTFTAGNPIFSLSNCNNDEAKTLLRRSDMIYCGHQQYIENRDKFWKVQRDKHFQNRRARCCGVLTIQKWIRRFLVTTLMDHLNNAAMIIQRKIRSISLKVNTKNATFLPAMIPVNIDINGKTEAKEGTFVAPSCAAITIQKYLRRYLAISNLSILRRHRKKQDLALYKSASAGDLEEVVAAFSKGAKPAGYTDAFGLHAAEKANSKGFTLVCSWLNAKSEEERAIVFKEWRRTQNS